MKNVNIDLVLYVGNKTTKRTVKVTPEHAKYLNAISKQAVETFIQALAYDKKIQ